MKVLEIGTIVKTICKTNGWCISKSGYLRPSVLYVSKGQVGEVIERKPVKVSSGQYTNFLNAYKIKFTRPLMGKELAKFDAVDDETWMRRSFISKCCPNLVKREEEICQKCKKRFLCFTE